jgi:beta-N-acetylhexosaminidase
LKTLWAGNCSSNATPGSDGNSRIDSPWLVMTAWTIASPKWNYQGVVMTDDLVMGAIYQHDVCTAVVEALNAAVDLLLVAFDGGQFYRIFACAAKAFAQGKLDAPTLRDSEMRLRDSVQVD